jgi:hypothetical protein
MPSRCPYFIVLGLQLALLLGMPAAARSIDAPPHGYNIELSLLTLPIKGIIIVAMVYLAFVLDRPVARHPPVHGILILVGTMLLIGTLGALIAAFTLDDGEAMYIRLVPGALGVLVLFILVGIRYLGLKLVDATILAVVFSIMTVACWFFSLKGWTDSIDPMAHFLEDVSVPLYILLGAVLMTIVYLTHAKSGEVPSSNTAQRTVHHHPLWLLGEIWVLAASFSGTMLLVLAFS